MKKNSPHKIDDTWYFRGKLMENCYPLFDGDYRWHKIQNCQKCIAKKSCSVAYTLLTVAK